MNLALPPNLMKMLKIISGPLSFNYFSEVNFAPLIFDIDPDGEYDTYNDAFAEFGFETNLAALNLADTVIWIAIFILGTPLALIIIRIQIFQNFKVLK